MLLSWCRCHLRVLCNLWKCWHKHVMKHLSPWWKKGVPRQRIRKWCHGNISVPVAHGDTGAKRKYADVRNMLKMVGWSRLPGSHGSTAWQTRRNVHEENGHSATIRFISDNMHSSMGHRLGGYTFEQCILGRFTIVEGSSRSRVIVEVVVHVRFKEVLDESNIFGATVVVHVL